jgi:hypothetical protein
MDGLGGTIGSGGRWRVPSAGALLAIGVAVFALVALRGPQSALATSLCKAAENPDCLAAKTYGIGTKFDLKAYKPNPVRFEATGVFDVICTETSAQLTLTEAGTPLFSQIKNMVFSGCADGEKTCTVTTRNEPLLSDIYKYSESAFWGRVSLVPREGAHPSWKLVCTGGINCVYGHSEEVSATLESGNSPVLRFYGKPLELEQGTCPKTAEVTAVYLFETSPIYVTTE